MLVLASCRSALQPVGAVERSAHPGLEGPPPGLKRSDVCPDSYRVSGVFGGQRKAEQVSETILLTIH